MLTDHLLTSQDNLTGNSSNQCRFFVVYWWFLLKGWKWYICCICYWNSFWSHRGRIFASAPQAELNVLTWACALAKGKTTNIYADSWHAFWVTHDFGMLWKQQCFLPQMGLKLKIALTSKIYLYVILVLATLAVINILGHSKTLPGNHLADKYIYTMNAALKEINKQISVLVQRDVSPNNYLEILTRDAQHLFPGKEKQYSKSSNCCLRKKRELWFGPNKNPGLPEVLNFHY